MDGDTHGTQTAGTDDARVAGVAQGHGGPQAQQKEVSAGTDYGAALRTKDEQIAELSAKVAEAAKTAEATSALNDEIAALKQQIADERVEFALKAAGAHDVRAARALWDDYEGGAEERAAAMAEANPWLFAGKASSGATSQVTSQEFGTTGLPSAGASGGGGDLARWERIAGLSDGKEV
jgi:hypothetical protein